ncbi:hypothetical protein GIB67_035233, partial [Kingdonia uniflora]
GSWVIHLHGKFSCVGFGIDWGWTSSNSTPLFFSPGPRASYGTLWISCHSKPRHSTEVWVSLWLMYFDFVGIIIFLSGILRECKK